MISGGLILPFIMAKWLTFIDLLVRLFKARTKLDARRLPIEEEEELSCTCQVDNISEKACSPPVREAPLRRRTHTPEVITNVRTSYH